MAVLTIETNNGSHVFDGSAIVKIGRDPSCDIVFDNPNVSRFHAEARPSGDEWTLVDTGSTQGVWVNGKRVPSQAIGPRTAATLGRGDAGEQLTFTLPAPAADDSPTELPLGATALGPDAEPALRPGGVLREPGTAAGTVVTGDALNVECAGKEYTFQPGKEIVIGRDDDCDIVSHNPTVSRRHASLRHNGSQWRLTDLQSTRGTFVDGRRITEIPVVGSLAAFLGDADAGERVVLVTAGERPVTASDRVRKSARSGSLVLAIAAIAVVAVIIAIIAITRGGGSGSPSNDDVARATVKVLTPQYTGSGTIIDKKKGLILTNAHVADSRYPGVPVQYPGDPPLKAPDEYTIAVSPGLDRAAEPQFRAKALLIDGYLDVAVLQITKTDSGALIGKDDLKGLTELKIGSSSKLKTGSKIRLVGYPGIAASLDPTLTPAAIANPIQDSRLNSNRAWFNVTGNVDPGNSGGAAVDDGNHLVGIPSAGTFDAEAGAKSNRVRPIDLAKPVIEAAEKGTSYTSPYVTLLNGKETVDTKLVAGVGDDGFSDGCDDSLDSPSIGDRAIGLQVTYDGFTPDKHQDMLVLVTDTDTDSIIGAHTTNAQYPFKFQATGCVTATIPLEAALVSGHKYAIVLKWGPSYNKFSTHLVSNSNSNTNNNSNNNDNNGPPGN